MNVVRRRDRFGETRLCPSGVATGQLGQPQPSGPVRTKRGLERLVPDGYLSFIHKGLRPQTEDDPVDTQPLAGRLIMGGDLDNHVGLGGGERYRQSTDVNQRAHTVNGPGGCRRPQRFSRRLGHDTAGGRVGAWFSGFHVVARNRSHRGR